MLSRQDSTKTAQLCMVISSSGSPKPLCDGRSYHVRRREITAHKRHTSSTNAVRFTFTTDPEGGCFQTVRNPVCTIPIYTNPIYPRRSLP